MKTRPYSLLSILAASIIWGLSGLFYKALAHVPPLEVLAHRTLWSLLLFGIILAFRGRLGAVRKALASPHSVAALALAALIFGEAFTIWHAIALPLIWAALALYYFETKRREALTPEL